MTPWYARTVFFVDDTAAAIDFYCNQLGFSQDWDYREQDRVLVAQVSRNDIEIILNHDPDRAGCGRIYFELLDEQVQALVDELGANSPLLTHLSWGVPVTAISDPDGNQVYFSPLLKDASAPDTA
jgi:catechol 2,3-dioxygenase-like lactoylglutathione lyase family enzyme